MVLVSSVSGHVGMAGQAAYGMTKSAVDGLARTLAVELAPRGVRVVEGEARRLVVENDRVTGFELADGSVLAADAVFLAPTWVAKDGPLTALGCEIGDDGFVKVDTTGRTSVPGVWAAGNVTSPGGQGIFAASAGSTAAAMVNADLIEDDVARKLAA